MLQLINYTCMNNAYRTTHGVYVFSFPNNFDVAETKEAPEAAQNQTKYKTIPTFLYIPIIRGNLTPSKTLHKTLTIVILLSVIDLRGRLTQTLEFIQWNRASPSQVRDIRRFLFRLAPWFSSFVVLLADLTLLRAVTAW